LLTGAYLSLLAAAHEDTTLFDLLRSAAASLPLLFATPPFVRAIADHATAAQPLPAQAGRAPTRTAPVATPPARTAGGGAATRAATLAAVPTVGVSSAGRPTASAAAAPAQVLPSALFAAGRGAGSCRLPLALLVPLLVLRHVAADVSRFLLHAPARILAQVLLVVLWLAPTLPRLLQGIANGFELGFRATYAGKKNTPRPNRAREGTGLGSGRGGATAGGGGDASSGRVARPRREAEDVCDPTEERFRSALATLRRAVLVVQAARAACLGVLLLGCVHYVFDAALQLADAWRGLRLAGGEPAARVYP